MHDGAVIPSPDGDRRAVVVPGPGALRTARLRLTPVAEHELDELLALHADPRAFAQDLTEPVTDRAQMRWVLRRWRESWDEHGVGYWSVRARAGAEGADRAGAGSDHERHRTPVPGTAQRSLPAGLLGVVGLTPLSLEDRTVLSAYWRLAPAATGLGVASEAMRAVLAEPRLGGWSEVVAVTAAGNAPSRALASRLGFDPAPPDRPVPGDRPGNVLLVRRDS